MAKTKYKADVHTRKGGYSDGQKIIQASSGVEAFDALYDQGYIASSMWYVDNGSWVWLGSQFCSDRLLTKTQNAF